MTTWGGAYHWGKDIHFCSERFGSVKPVDWRLEMLGARIAMMQTEERNPNLPKKTRDYTAFLGSSGHRIR